MTLKTLTGDELQQAKHWLALAAETAGGSSCRRRRCGSIIVSKNGDVLARSENKLPGCAGQAHIHCDPYATPPGFKSDKACCIHAEQRAVMGALANGHDLTGAIMVFASVDDEGAALPSGKPYCTICSKMALEAGIGWWILEHATGVVQYEAAAYNALSFQYNGE